MRAIAAGWARPEGGLDSMTCRAAGLLQKEAAPGKVMFRLNVNSEWNSGNNSPAGECVGGAYSHQGQLPLKLSIERLWLPSALMPAVHLGLPAIS